MMPGNPVVGGTVLRRAAIQSPDFVAGSAGWAINADGTAQFNGVTFYGPGGLSVTITASGVLINPPGLAAGGAGSLMFADAPGDLQVSSGSVSALDTEAAIQLTSALSGDNVSGGKTNITMIVDTVTLIATAAQNIPFSSAGITTVAQLVTALKGVGILS